jgi:hypothetical protein
MTFVENAGALVVIVSAFFLILALMVGISTVAFFVIATIWDKVEAIRDRAAGKTY